MALSAEPDLKVPSGNDKDPYDGDTASSGPSVPVKMIALLVGISIVVGGVAVAFGPRIMNMIAEGDGEVPVIAAEAAPIKVRPENPGGMQVPNQDRLVYGVVDGTASEPRVERLLPSPERPVDVDQVLTRSVPEVSSVVTENAPLGTDDVIDPAAPTALAPPRAIGTPAAPTAPPTPDATTRSTEASAASDPVATSNEALTAASNTPPPPAPEPPAPAPQPAASSSSPASPQTSSAPTTVARATPAPAAPITDLSQAFRVQLAAARSEAAVTSEWDRLRRRNVDLLGDLSLQVTRIDLGATKGVFYRLRVGPLESETSAKSLCERLKQRKLGCLVVRPGS